MAMCCFSSLSTRLCLVVGPLALAAGAFDGPVFASRGPAAPTALTFTRATPHLAFVATLSHDTVVPGARISIVVDVTPKKGMHVYAPGASYRPFVIAPQPHPLLRVHDSVYPKPTEYLFEPLNEKVLVYAAPFRVVRDITIGDTAARRAELRSHSELTIKNILAYQACDDTVCYLPASIPFEWTVKVQH